MTAKEIGDLDLVREMLGMFGARRTASLLGWASLFGLTGVKSRADMLASPLGSQATRYRILSDFRAFRDHLIAAGYVVSETGDADADVEQIVSTLAHAA